MSIDFSIFNLSSSKIEDCKIFLKQILVEKLEKKLYDVNAKISLNQLDERILQDPHLFSVLLHNKPSITLLQVIIGYLNKIFNCSFEVNSDAYGRVYFPNYGYIETPNNNSKLLINRAERDCITVDNKRKYPIVKNHLINNKIVCYTHILNTSDSEISINEDPSKTLKKSLKTIDNTFNFFKRKHKLFHEVLNSVIEGLFVFNKSNYNSFADISYHGAIFLNIMVNHNSEAYFIDDISHQSGHVIFNLLTLNTKTYLKYPKQTLINGILSNVQDSRSIYSIFHGLFTYSTILINLHIYINSNQHQSDEALARIGFYLGKMYADLNMVYKADFLTENGKEYYDKCLSIYKSIYSIYAINFRGVKYINQPYVFDYEKYKELN